MRRRLRALPLLTGAALVSNIGGVVQTTVLACWLARSTGSASALGLLAFCTIAPTLLTTPLGEWLADRTSLPGMLVGAAVGLVLLAALWAPGLRAGVLETPAVRVVQPQPAVS